MNKRMMNMGTGGILFALGVAILALCTACGPKAQSPAASSSAAAGGYDKHLTYTMTMLDAEHHGKSARDRWLLDKFNIDFNFIAVTFGDWNEKVRAMVAGDDIPDILFWDFKLRNSLEVRMWAEQGAFREIKKEDITKRPNLQALLDQMDTDDKVLTIDGKLYGFPGRRAVYPFLKGSSWQIYSYRRDWAKAVGMYREGDIYTWDETLAMIDAIKKQDPGKNGPGNTFGITNISWAFPDLYVQLQGQLMNRAGYQKGPDGYVPVFTLPGWRNEVKHLAKLYREGYIWKDQIFVRGNEGLDNFKAGRSFMYLGSGGPDFFNDQLYPAMLDTGVISSTEDIGPMLIRSPVDNKTFVMPEEVDFWAVNFFSHNLSDEKYERILDYWEWLAGDEDGRAWYWAGIPDVDYKRIANDKIELLWKKADDGRWINPYEDTLPSYLISVPRGFLPYPDMVNRAGYDTYAPVIDLMTNSPDYKVVRKWAWELYTFDGPLYSQFADFRSQEIEFVRQVIAGNENVDTAIDRWLREMEPRWRPVADELNKSL